jgi:hypothetical protein
MLELLAPPPLPRHALDLLWPHLTPFASPHVQRPSCRPHSEAALESLSIDGSWIKRSEMLNAWIESVDGSERRPSRSYSDEELRAAFDAIDTDKSGDIDLDELRTAIRAIKTTSDEAAVQQMLALADEDGSGAIDFEEFKELMSLRRRGAV